MNQEALYNQDMLSQIPPDLLSFCLPPHDGTSTPNKEFSDTLFSNTEDSEPEQPLELSGLYTHSVNNVSPLDGTFASLDSLANLLPTPNYNISSSLPVQGDLEEFLTPLVSPAITPSYTDIYEFLDPPNEQYFTPLSSPALYSSTSNKSLSDNTTSSAEISTNSQNAAALSQKLAQIEAKQKLLRDQLVQSPTSPAAYCKSPLALFSTRQQAPPSPLPFANNKRRPTLRQQIALASPQLHSSQNHHISLPTIPATPASLMKMKQQQQPISSASTIINASNIPIKRASITSEDMTIIDTMPSLPPTAFPLTTDVNTTVANKKRKLAPSSPVVTMSLPRTLKPLISPFLQPDLKTVSPIAFTPDIENRRSAHKVAEQRRRDTLKQSFDSLRKEIADVLVMDASLDDNNNNNKKFEEAIRLEKEKEVKLMSKVLLLQHSYEYIVRLKNDGIAKDQKMKKMQLELEELRKLAASFNQTNSDNLE